uniref:Uncharacterized protein n=1 Tax=Rhizophora mucronata TaxID=61149 RepID=A0A2P2P0Y0_RHIMU
MHQWCILWLTPQMSPACSQGVVFLLCFCYAF